MLAIYLLLYPVFVLAIAGIVSLVEARIGEKNHWSLDHD